jgi:beta-galactosidase
MTLIPQPPYIGAAWYPEAWDESVAPRDIALARQLGVNLFRLAEFAWSTMQPEEGKCDFAWLHRALDLLADNDMAAMLCTPTATPPAWLTSEYPETVAVRRDGVRFVHGSRRHNCPSSPRYRELSRNIVEKMAIEFKGHRAVVAWQIDNEFGCHNQECYCDQCRRAFHQWLERKYGTLDRLNDSWGTRLWSQTYSRWSEIPLPQATPFLHHPSLRFAFRNYMSDMYAECCHEQYEVLKTHGHPNVTTDGMPPFHALDYAEMFRPLDMVADNIYLNFENYDALIAECDWMRPFHPGRPYWITESATVHTGAGALGDVYIHHPGATRARGWLQLALGSEAVMYWLWRTHWSGQEMLCAGIVSSWGEPSLVAPEISQLARESHRLADLLRGTEVVRPALAVHRSTQAAWIFEAEPQIHGFNYIGAWQEHVHRPLVRANIPRDVLFPGSPVDNYKVVLSPFLSIIPPDLLERMRDFVESGGTWILTPFCGIRDEHATQSRTNALGPLEEMLPIRVKHRYPPHADGPRVKWHDGNSCRARLWCDAFETTDPNRVRILATYEDGPTKGMAAAVECALGEGNVILLGHLPDTDDRPGWLPRLLKDYGIEPAAECDPGITTIFRTGPAGSFCAVIDYAGKGGKVRLPRKAKDALTGSAVAKQISLQPWAVRLMRFD